MKFEPDQQVMLKMNGKEWEPAVIHRVGRKYAYVRVHGRELKFDGETGYGDRTYGYGDYIRTEEMHVEAVRHSKVAAILKGVHNITYVHNNFRQSAETLEKVLAVLNEALAADTTRCNPITDYHATPHKGCILR